MTESFDQPPLFDIPESWKTATKEGFLSEKLAEIADQHALALDLIALGMKLTPYINVSREDAAAFNAISDKLLEQNTPVVIYLVRVLADILHQIGADPDRVMAKLRKAVAVRINEAEQELRKRGFQP